MGAGTSLAVHICAAAFVFLQADNAPKPAAIVESANISIKITSHAEQPKAVPSVETKPEPKPEPRPKVKKQVQPKQKPAPKALARKSQEKPASESQPAPQPTAGQYSPAPDKQQELAAKRAQEQTTIESYLLAQVEKYKRYPQAARRIGLEGIVHMKFTIDGQGALFRVELAAHSAHQILARSARQTMDRIQKNWTPVSVSREISIIVPLRYTLNDR